MKSHHTLIISIILIYLLGITTAVIVMKSSAKEPKPCSDKTELKLPSFKEPQIQKVQNKHEGYVEPLNIEWGTIRYREETHHGHLYGIWIIRSNDGTAMSTQRID